jgi:Ca2+/Na+ antiporter
LFVVCFLLGWRRQKPSWIWGAAFGIVLCFMSIVVASSRGAVLFSLTVLLMAFAVFFFRLRRVVPSGAEQANPRFSNYKIVLLFLLLAVALVLGLSIKKDARWHAMADNVRAAFMVEDPVDFLCNGVSPNVTEKIQARFAARDPQYVQQLIQGFGADGGRILLMRAGFELVLQQPLGLDGSRHSYKKLIEERCGHPPVMEFAHAHQGWIDTALALGWGGGLLLACLMLYFVLAGWSGVAHEAGWPWAFALLLLASFWLLRGFADSVYREHYLQMQALLLSYLFGRMTLANRGAR